MKYYFKQLTFPVKRQWMKEALYIAPCSVFGLCLDTRMTGSSVRACPFPLSKFSKSQRFQWLFLWKDQKNTTTMSSLASTCLITWISTRKTSKIVRGFSTSSCCLSVRSARNNIKRNSVSCFLPKLVSEARFLTMGVSVWEGKAGYACILLQDIKESCIKISVIMCSREPVGACFQQNSMQKLLLHWKRVWGRQLL